MSDADISTGREVIKTDSREVTIDRVLLYVVEINDELAKASGLDLPSAVSGTIDGKAVIDVARKVGLNGEGYIKITKGKAYLILKGPPGQRAVLNGTRYLASNPKVANLIISPRDMAKGSVKATGLAVVAFVAMRVVEHILSEGDPSLTRLLGNIASDVTKFAASAALGFLAGAAVGTMTTVLAGPFIAAFVVGVGASILLDRVDRRFGLTEMMITAIEDTVDGFVESFKRPFRELARQMNAWERHLINQAINQSLRRY